MYYVRYVPTYTFIQWRQSAGQTEHLRPRVSRCMIQMIFYTLYCNNKNKNSFFSNLATTWNLDGLRKI